MAATLYFYAGLGDVDQRCFSNPDVPYSSGLGFFGDGWSTSVQVDYWQQSTFITNGGGTVMAGQANNNTRDQLYDDDTPTTSGIVVNGASAIEINKCPNNSGTLNVRFTYDSSVDVQNATAYLYDRISKDNNPSGVKVAMAQLVHPSLNPTIVSTSGSSDWKIVEADSADNSLALINSPGISGLTPSGSASTQHDWYMALCASPTSIGKKEQFGLYIQLDYL